MFLLDIRYDHSTITKWIKDDAGTRPVHEAYYPSIYLSCKPEMQPLVASLPGVRKVHVEKKSTGLGSAPEELICATVDPGAVYDTASMLEAKGCGLYNIDLDPVRQYLLERSLFPMIKLDGSDSQFAIDYELPPLASMKLSLTPERDRGIATTDDPIRSITLGDTVLEDGDEAGLLKMVSREVAAIDPDIILTEHGDNFDLPYLYHHAALYDIDLQLGREKDVVRGVGKSYFRSTRRCVKACL